MEIKALEFLITKQHEESVISAADQMGVDLIIEKDEIEKDGLLWKKALILGDNSTIFGLGFLSGVDSYHNATSEPLQKLVNDLENRINNIKKEKDGRNI